MAIYSSVPPPEQQSVVVGVAAHAAALTTSSPAAKVQLVIPLTEPIEGRGKDGRKEPLRRDSMRRREALLKGVVGSRRRVRWENDNFLNVPNAQPPLPSDWEVHPTYPVHNNIPYYLAPLWDAGIRHRAEDRAAAKSKARSAPKVKGGRKEEVDKGVEKEVVLEGKGKVPQELRAKMKKAKGAKTLLQELELEIRRFVRDWETAHSTSRKRSSSPELDSEDEEIVFIGRKAIGGQMQVTMSDEQKEVMEEELKREMRVYECLKGSKEGGFARWLVHSLAEYYGLGSKSVDVGGRREAWVCVREEKGSMVGERMGMGVEGLRPLWGLV